MKVLITGMAGFIGHNLAKALVANNIYVLGVDNLNDYYNVQLKKDRLRDIGFTNQSFELNFQIHSEKTTYLSFIFNDITNSVNLKNIFSDFQPDVVCHLAAQAVGARLALGLRRDDALPGRGDGDGTRVGGGGGRSDGRALTRTLEAGAGAAGVGRLAVV